MIEDYSYPTEMPDIFVDDDGIVNILFGSLQITVEHMVHSVTVHRRLVPNKKSLVLLVGEAAISVQGQLSMVGSSDWFSEVTTAVAIVTQTKLGRILGNIFMNIHKNPYPTKIFNDEESAKAWLLKDR